MRWQEALAPTARVRAGLYQRRAQGLRAAYIIDDFPYAVSSQRSGRATFEKDHNLFRSQCVVKI